MGENADLVSQSTKFMTTKVQQQTYVANILCTALKRRKLLGAHNRHFLTKGKRFS